MIEILFPDKINSVTAKDLREIVFDIEDAEADHLTRLEFDEHVDVTVWPKIIRQYEPNRQLA